MRQLAVAVMTIAVAAMGPSSTFAQVSSGAPGSTRPESPAAGAGGGKPSSSETTGAPGSPATAPVGSNPTDSPGSPSASPPAPSDDFAKYTTPTDCEKAGGMWLIATGACTRR
jgi:hypothetical protein